MSGSVSVVETRLRGLRREHEPGPSWRARLHSAGDVVRQIGEVLPRSPKELGRMERKLMQAGFRRPESVYVFHGLQALCSATLLLTFLATGWLQRNLLLFGLVALFFGAALPDVTLARLIKARQLRIQLGLPDILDLMVVGVEAGLGLDQALMRVAEELRQAQPDLCDELRQYTLEVNAGRRRAEALRNLGARSDVEDLRALVAVLIQTDRFGTSIADSLRVFSDSLRTKRRQRAEERAAKLPVKMLIPLFLFIFPATLIVVAGPAMLHIGTTLIPSLAGGR